MITLCYQVAVLTNLSLGIFNAFKGEGGDNMKNNKGFTLIELLVVIAIIGLLSTLAVVALNNAREKARDAKRVADVKRIQTALELYFDTNGGYPGNTGTDAHELGATGYSTLSSGGHFSDTASGDVYMSGIPEAPTPPSDNAYEYTADGTDATADATTYGITFTLEGNVGNLATGSHCASPTGIISGACTDI